MEDKCVDTTNFVMKVGTPFDGYKQRLLNHRNDYRAVNRIMAYVEECADLTLDEYLELCDIANGRDLQ